MRNSHWFVLVAALSAAAILLAACVVSAPPAQVAPTRNADGYVRITPDELAEMLENKDFPLVDVHVPYEGEIEGTDIHIPFDEISEHLDELPAKDDRIVIYCRSGSMSTTAAKEMAKLGFTDVLELEGGMRAWQSAGYELVTRQ